jgi:hypothetical protein
MMKTEEPRTPPGLYALCQQAGEDAARWQAGATRGSASARRAARAAPPRRRLLKFGLVTGLSLLTLAVVAAQFRSVPAAARSQVATRALPPPVLDPQPSTVAAASTVEPVRWHGSELLMDLDEVPLPQAVALLARATRTTVSGMELLRLPAPVTLHSVFVSAEAAWQQLLRSRAGFSITCAAAACRLWIAGESAAPAAAALPSAEKTRSVKPRTPEEQAAEELEQSQPGGSC